MAIAELIKICVSCLRSIWFTRYETFSQTATGLVAVEKGTTFEAEVDLMPDDVRIELLVSS